VYVVIVSLQICLCVLPQQQNQTVSRESLPYASFCVEDISTSASSQPSLFYKVVF